MRSVVWLCACALWLTTGCTHTHQVACLNSEQQWEDLCHRMPQREMISADADAHQSPLTHKQKTSLQRIALESLDAIVRIKTSHACSDEALNHSSKTRATSANYGGTGIVIKSNGLILTNEHVVRHARDVTVIFRDGTAYVATAIIVHPHLDVAVLKIDRTQIPCTSPSVEVLKSGAPVVAVATANDQDERCCRTGVVTSVRKSLQRELDPAGRRDYGYLVETTVKLEPGFSGGPLLDTEGRLVGINVAVAGSPGTNSLRGYAIPFSMKVNDAIGQLVALAEAPTP